MASFKEIFTSKLANKRNVPSSRAWEQMEAMIDAEPALNPRRNAWAYWPAAAVLLLSLSAGYWFFDPSDSDPAKAISNESINTSVIDPFVNENSTTDQSIPSPEQNFSNKINTAQPSSSQPIIAASSNPIETNAQTELSSNSNEANLNQAPPSISTNHSASKFLDVATVDLNTKSIPSALSIKGFENAFYTKQAVHLPLHQTNLGSKWQLAKVNALVDFSRGNENGEQSTGFGAELLFTNNNWEFAVGAINSNVSIVEDYQEWNSEEVYTQVDRELINETTEMVVDSIWVILGVNKGVYEYDTNYVTNYDTIIYTTLDTSVNEYVTNQQKRTVLNYTEIPLHIRYGWQIKRFKLSAGLGLTYAFLTESIKNETATEIEKSNLIDGSVQAGLEYFITDNLSTMIRPNYRFNLMESGNLRGSDSRLGLQWGLSLYL